LSGVLHRRSLFKIKGAERMPKLGISIAEEFTMVFTDRQHAGKLLGNQLRQLQLDNVLILALPRGGVPVAVEIAAELKAPLDVLIVRKIGHPYNPELAMGAICEEEEPHFNEALLAQMNLDPDDLERAILLEQTNIARQTELFRQGHEFPDVRDKTIIIVDDGLATGATMSAAVKYLRKKGAAKIIVAAPVGAISSAQAVGRLADQVVILENREVLLSVSRWYEDFPQVSDHQVISLLKAQERRFPALHNSKNLISRHP
jgi:putative phosphoribosyl transferase